MTNQNDTNDIVRLQELADAGDVLQQALMKRDADAIFSAIARHETISKMLQAGWRRISVIKGQPQEQSGTTKETIKLLVGKIRRTQRVNSMIATSFMRLVNATLASTSKQNDPKSMLYGTSGILETRNTPIFVQQKG